MKLSIIFDRWAEANKERIESEGKEFALLVGFAGHHIKNVVESRNGVSHVIAAAALETFEKLDAELKARGIKRPDITIPKIKIVHPVRRRK